MLIVYEEGLIEKITHVIQEAKPWKKVKKAHLDKTEWDQLMVEFDQQMLISWNPYGPSIRVATIKGVPVYGDK